MRCSALSSESPLKHPLSSSVVGLIEAGQRDLEVSMSRDIDAEDFARNTAVKAFEHLIALQGIVVCFTARDLEFRVPCRCVRNRQR